jgi:hypothetical protein
VKYRQRGRFDLAIANLRAMADEKRRSGRDLPFLNWRYILFNWNDSDEEMNTARQLATEVGVDRLCWEITDHPEDGYSRRFVPGAPAFDTIRHEIWDDSGLGNAIPGATPKARIDVRAPVMGVGVPGLPLMARAGRSLRVHTRVHNLSERPFPAQATYGRRLVRVGAQLCDAGGTLINRDYARAWLPETLAPGGQTNVAIDLTAPVEPGRYSLKFDLVCEGVDWFERCGSQTTIKPLWVR